MKEKDFERAQKIIFAPPVSKSGAKLAGRRVKLKGGEYMQFERLENNQAFHENIRLENLAGFFERVIQDYKQANIFLDDAHYIAFNKGGAVKFHRGKSAAARPEAGHNRRKNYIINEGDNIQALVELGIFTREFKIVNSMYGKFKQINRFVELFADMSGRIDEIYAEHGKLRVIDFGCGKSYLTFILYHYLASVKQIPERDLQVTGVDLKAGVIQDCERLARKHKYAGLRFAAGDIQAYEPEEPPHIVVSLHGCDTATDHALYRAIKWRAGIIFAAPCCEHELNAQPITGMPGVLKHGALKERFAAMLTNAIRCNLLELQGYRAELIEFVELSHSPKNLLIRAKLGRARDLARVRRELDEMLAQFGVRQSLHDLLMT